MNFPGTPAELLTWDWPQFEPIAAELAAQRLNADNVMEWLRGWSRFYECIKELENRLYVATTVDTADEVARQRYTSFMEKIYPPGMAAQQKFKEMLLASGLQPPGFIEVIKKLDAEARLFRDENLPLLGEEKLLSTAYDEIEGSQTAQWEGRELTIEQFRPLYQDANRARREQAWRLALQRQLADREKINALWQKYMALRQKMAANAAQPDFRAYRWQSLLRLDYTPADCRTFHAAIEQVAVPAARRIYARRQQRLGLASLRPWDLDVDPGGLPPLRPFNTIPELVAGCGRMFQHVDPQLGACFVTMQAEGLLDLENRKNKASGAYCIDYTMIRRPFVFENAVGLHLDVQALLHEGGHAFHVFETAGVPFTQQLMIPLEFAEVASMAIELLASPYLAAEEGGFYSPRDAARALVEHLERSILFWPYMAVVDAFQHWVYENPDQSIDPACCDRTWTALWDRFMVGVNWSGLDAEKATGWQRKVHIHEDPFYYVEYGLAQLGAVQVWRNAMQDQAGAVAAYRRALALGGAVSLPELFRAAGAKLAFDAVTLGEAVALMEAKITELETTA